MSDLLFAVPWWIPALLAVIGIALFVNGNKTQAAKVRNGGLGLIVLAIVWALVSFLIDTDKEKVEKGTTQAIQAIVDSDWKKFKSSLTPTAGFAVGSSMITGADNVVAIAKNGVELVHVKTAHLQNMEIEQTHTLITVHCDIVSTQDSYAPIETSSWQFDWEETSSGWKLREMRLLKLKDVAGDQLDGVIPKGIVK